MIPNNQYFYNNGKNIWPPVDDNYEYVSEYIGFDEFPLVYDGNVLFESESGTIRQIGGWNGTLSPTTINLQFESTDDGATWNAIANAPWVGRHNFANGWMNGKFWVVGGDDNQVVGGQRDVWTWDAVNDWVQVTSDWGVVPGNKVGCSFAVKNNYFYLIGGTGQDVVRSNDGINWTKMGDLPLDIQTYVNGYAFTHKNYIYILGGDPGTSYKVYRTINGSSYEYLSDLPNTNTLILDSFQGTQWSRAWAKWGVLFFLSGTGAGGNRRSLVYSEDDGLTWKVSFSPVIMQNHARGIVDYQDSIVMAGGTTTRFVERYIRVLKASYEYKVLYSLKKVNSAYTGSCIRIRRSSDNAQQDIGFDVNGDLDTSAITTFVGANSAFVVTWYEQSGNGYDITQSNATFQPRIVNAGTIETQDGYAAINFTSTAIRLEYASNINIGNQYSCSVVCAGNNNMIIGASSIANSYMIYNAGTLMYHNNGDTSAAFAASATFAGSINTDRYLLSGYRNRKIWWAYRNSSVNTTPNAWLSTTLMPEGFVGPALYESAQYFKKIGNESGGSSFVGKMQEFQIKTGYFYLDINTSQAADINGRWGVY